MWGALDGSLEKGRHLCFCCDYSDALPSTQDLRSGNPVKVPTLSILHHRLALDGTTITLALIPATSSHAVTSTNHPTNLIYNTTHQKSHKSQSSSLDHMVTVGLLPAIKMR